MSPAQFKQKSLESGLEKWGTWRSFFAVPYDNREKKPFYVDFIVKLKDGRIRFFDTKDGFTKQVTGLKIDGLNIFKQRF